MAQDATQRQGFHAALIPTPATGRVLKHLPGQEREMLQEFHAASR
jgi:hypothetical protein